MVLTQIPLIGRGSPLSTGWTTFLPLNSSGVVKCLISLFFFPCLSNSGRTFRFLLRHMPSFHVVNETHLFLSFFFFK